jgi:multidrug efflux system membrane fusion protein
VEHRTVELGPSEGDLRVIVKGLSGDERIVVEGLQKARDGAVVRPVEATGEQPSESGPSTEAGSAGQEPAPRPQAAP